MYARRPGTRGRWFLVSIFPAHPLVVHFPVMPLAPQRLGGVMVLLRLQGGTSDGTIRSWMG